MKTAILFVFLLGSLFAQTAPVEFSKDQQALLKMHGLNPSSVASVVIVDGQVTGAVLNTGRTVAIKSATASDYTQTKDVVYNATQTPNYNTASATYGSANNSANSNSAPVEFSKDQQALLKINGLNPSSVASVIVVNGKVTGAVLNSGRSITIKQPTTVTSSEQGGTLPRSTYKNPISRMYDNIYGTKPPSGANNGTLIDLYTGNNTSTAGSTANYSGSYSSKSTNTYRANPNISSEENNFLRQTLGGDANQIAKGVANGKGGFSSVTLKDGSVIDLTTGTKINPDGSEEEYSPGMNSSSRAAYTQTEDAAYTETADKTYDATGKPVYKTAKTPTYTDTSAAKPTYTHNTVSLSGMIQAKADAAAAAAADDSDIAEVGGAAGTGSTGAPLGVDLMAAANAAGKTNLVSSNEIWINSTEKDMSRDVIKGFTNSNWDKSAGKIDTNYLKTAGSIEGLNGKRNADGSVEANDHPFKVAVASIVRQMKLPMYIMSLLSGLFGCLSLQKDGRWDNFSVRFFGMVGISGTLCIMAVLT